MNCFVCDEKFNKVKHNVVKCIYCNFEACRYCCEKYILDQTVAKCMNNACDKQWTRKFLADNFTKAFITGPWKKNLEKTLFDREKALLPATQIVVEERRERNVIKAKMLEIDEQIANLKREREALHLQFNQTYHNNNTNAATRRQFIRACPDEHCRGFLSSQWKCGLCDKWSCPDCHVVKGLQHDGEHTCDPNDLETAKLLDKDTKPCPKCATGIFKIDGCDQMWCILCHTAFSWRTGIIETHVHNPHYYEWQRRNNGGVAPRTDLDNHVCGEELNVRVLRNILSHIPKNASDMKQEIEYIYQSVMHLQEVQMGRFRINRVENNLELRVEYLNSDITEDDFKVKVQRANKQHEKRREMSEILTLFMFTTTEIFLRLHQYVTINRGNIDGAVIMRFLDEFEGIRSYTNECLADISKTYHSQLKAIEFYNCSAGRRSHVISESLTTNRNKDRDVLISL